VFWTKQRLGHIRHCPFRLRPGSSTNFSWYIRVKIASPTFKASQSNSLLPAIQMPFRRNASYVGYFALSASVSFKDAPILISEVVLLHIAMLHPSHYSLWCESLVYLFHVMSRTLLLFIRILCLKAQCKTGAFSRQWLTSVYLFHMTLRALRILG
jgi:hypothetical protein